MSELVYYKPDLIIVYDGWNDSAYNNILINEYGEQIFPLKTPTHYQLDERFKDSYTLRGGAKLFLNGLRSFLYKKFDRFALIHLIKRGWAKFYFLISKKSIYDTKEYKYNSKSVEMYKENLEKIIMTCKLHGIRVALFLQPLMGVDNKILTAAENVFFKNDSNMPVTASFYNDAQLMFKNLKSKHNEKGKACIEDLSLLFADVKETVYVDSGHLLLRGNEIVAQEIVETIRECNILK